MPAVTPPRSATALRVRFFGPLRTLVKSDGCEIPWPAHGSVNEFWLHLIERFPVLETERPTTRLARNAEFLMENDRLQPGDEVALIPPVSGG
jgi:molybdopterin converting factor small subunit